MIGQSQKGMQDASPGLMRTLGRVSLGLGIPQMIMPRTFSRLIGTCGGDTTRTITRFVGLSNMAVGGGIMARPRSAGTLFGLRVGGDLVDMGLLTLAMAQSGSRRLRLGMALAGVAGLTLADVLAARWASGRAEPMRVVAAITVRRPRDEVYRAWHDFANLPSFMAHLVRVEVSGSRSHWVARGPAGRTVEWDAETTADQPNELIAWRSVGKATIQNSGRVRFSDAPGDRGTEVVVELEYGPAAGLLGRSLAMTLGEDPRQQVHDDLRRFKQVLETGQIVRSEGSPEGTLAERQLHQRPARPMAA